MKTSLSVLAASLSFALVACGGSTINTAGTTTTGGAGTTGGTTTTTTSGGGTTGTVATAGGTTGAAPLDCWSSYPAADPAIGYGTGSDYTWPETPLLGGNSLNFSATPVMDSTTFDTTHPTLFQSFHALNEQGFRYMLFDISGVWCPNCRNEANELPHQQYVPTWLQSGGIVFTALVQGNSESTGASATTTDLASWINTYGTNYPISLDTEQTLVTVTSTAAWPANFIIRLRDMKIMDTFYGNSVGFYAEFESDLALTDCSNDNDCIKLGKTCSIQTCAGTGVCQ